MSAGDVRVEQLEHYIMASPPNTTPHGPAASPESVRQGQEFISQVQRKIDRLVQEFADGQINRAQFQRLYARYQRQITTVMQLMANTDPSRWREAIFETEDTLKLRKRFAATTLGLSLYESRSGRHIRTLGEFRVEDWLITPMLQSYRAAASQNFRAGPRGAELEDGRWLCFLPGGHTMLIALFSQQPADDQLALIERMHQDFEEANLTCFESGRFDATQLVYPFHSLVSHGSGA